MGIRRWASPAPLPSAGWAAHAGPRRGIARAGRWRAGLPAPHGNDAARGRVHGDIRQFSSTVMDASRTVGLLARFSGKRRWADEGPAAGRLPAEAGRLPPAAPGPDAAAHPAAGGCAGHALRVSACWPARPRGQSWLALALALAVAKGEPFLGHDALPGGVLYRIWRTAATACASAWPRCPMDAVPANLFSATRRPPWTGTCAGS